MSTLTIMIIASILMTFVNVLKPSALVNTAVAQNFTLRAKNPRFAAGCYSAIIITATYVILFSIMGGYQWLFGYTLNQWPTAMWAASILVIQIIDLFGMLPVTPNKTPTPLAMKFGVFIFWQQFFITPFLQ